MLRVLGHSTRACDGLTRRELLTAGTLAMAGLVPGVASPAKPGGTFGQAKSVILLDLFGGGQHYGTPGCVCLLAYLGCSQGLRRAGPFGGYLGSQFNPMFSTCDPKWDREIDANKDFYNHLVKPVGVPQLPKLTGDLTI